MHIDPSRPGSVAVAAVACGVVAGLLAALFLTVTAEPSIEEAIRIEQARATAGPHHVDEPHEDDVVSRDVQKGVGLFAAYGVSGAAFGLLFAAGFMASRRGQPDPFRRALVVGLVLAGGLTVSPWLKYSPNPPAVGDPDTLTERQLAYVAVIVLTLLVLASAARLGRRLRQGGWDDARRAACVVLAVTVPLGLAYTLLPPSPDPGGVPASLLWRFRLASLGGNLVLWSALTLSFGVLVTRARVRRSDPVLVP